MGEVFLFKGIRPQKLNIKQIRQELLNEARKEGTDQKKALRPTVKTWRGEKPKFETLVGLERPPGGVTVLTGPVGSEKAVLKWTWLDQGTKKNYPCRGGRLINAADYNRVSIFYRNCIIFIFLFSFQ